MNYEIYKKMYVGGGEFPVFLWFLEKPSEKEDHDGGREQMKFWLDQFCTRELMSSEKTSESEIAMNIRYLIQNALEKIRLGREPQDVIYFYFFYNYHETKEDDEIIVDVKFNFSTFNIGKSMSEIHKQDPNRCFPPKFLYEFQDAIFNSLLFELLRVYGSEYKKTPVDKRDPSLFIIEGALHP